MWWTTRWGRGFWGSKGWGLRWGVGLGVRVQSARRFGVAAHARFARIQAAWPRWARFGWSVVGPSQLL